MADSLIAVIPHVVGVCIMVIVCRWGMRFLGRQFDECMKNIQHDAYRAGRTDGWEMHEKWSEMTGHDYSAKQGKPQWEYRKHRIHHEN